MSYDSDMMEDILTDTTLTSSDFMAIKMLQEGDTSGKWLGFKWIPYERLYDDGSTKFAVAWAKSGIQFGTGFTSGNVQRRADKKDTLQVSMAASYGALRTQSEKVVEIAFQSWRARLMAEIVSLEAAIVAAGNKMRNDVALGRVQVVSISSPATAAWAQNDTIASPVALPTGTRILGYKVFHEAMGTSVTMDIGLRQNNAAQTVVDVDGIADGLDVASAGIKTDAAAAGVMINVGTNTIYRTSVATNIYATLLSANPTDDAQFRIDVYVALPG